MADDECYKVKNIIFCLIVFFVWGTSSLSYAAELRPLPALPFARPSVKLPAQTLLPQYLLLFNQKIAPLTCVQLKKLSEQFSLKIKQSTNNRSKAYFGQHRTLIDQKIAEKRC